MLALRVRFDLKSLILKCFPKEKLNEIKTWYHVNTSSGTLFIAFEKRDYEYIGNNNVFLINFSVGNEGTIGIMNTKLLW